MKTYRALFPFGGLGLGARGFLDATATLFGVESRFECIGGIDFDKEACADFETLTGVPELHADVCDLTVEDVRHHFGAIAPDVVFMSPPCKGASSLLSEDKSQTDTYREMNRLALVWTRLMLAAWRTPPRLVLLENVPGIERRAAGMLAEVCEILRANGYVIHKGSHDCGEIGGLAQRRKRFLLVARHQPQVASLLYQPPRKRVRGVGEVLGALPIPLPGNTAGGPMHRLPRLQWINWMRLALIPAGGDWHDIPAGLYQLRAKAHPHTYGVLPWDGPAHTITGTASVGTGPNSVADPRLGCAPRNGAYGVLSWDEASRTITGSLQVDNGTAAVGDPRVDAIERALRTCPEPPPVIIAADGTWHRPMTVLELAALQGLPTTINGQPLVLAGNSAARWIERVGNGVPRGTAEAIARQMLMTLRNADAGTWALSGAGDGDVWVEPERVGLHS